MLVKAQIYIDPNRRGNHSKGHWRTLGVIDLTSASVVSWLVHHVRRYKRAYRIIWGGEPLFTGKYNPGRVAAITDNIKGITKLYAKDIPVKEKEVSYG